MNYLGLNIRKIRENWGLSQEEFGILIRATRGMIMQYERRGTKPKNDTVSRIVKLTGLPAEKLTETELTEKEVPEIDKDSELTVSHFRREPAGFRDLLDEEELMVLRANDADKAGIPRTTDGNFTGKQYDPDLVEFLKSNDAFFKNQYTTFNAQVLANLTALMNQQKNLEALLKINLEHTGNIEAAQLGVPAEQIHDNINRDILAAAGVEIDNGVRSPGKG